MNCAFAISSFYAVALCARVLRPSIPPCRSFPCAFELCHLLAIVAVRCFPVRGRHSRHAASHRSGRQRRPHRLRVRERSLGREPRRQRRAAADVASRRRVAARASRRTGSGSPSPAATKATPTSTSSPSDGRRAEAADVASARTTSPLGFTPDGKSSSSPRRARSTPGATCSSSPCRSAAGWPRSCPSRTRPRRSTRRTERRSSTSRSATPSTQWKHYRGGQRRESDASSTTTTYATEQSRSRPRAATTPIRCGSAASVYFLSDRDGEFNLYSYDPASKKVAQLTNHSDFPVINAIGRRRQDHLRAGRLRAPLRSEDVAASSAREDRRRRRSRRDAAALRQRDEVHPQRQPLAVRRARGLRIPRRDLHRAGARRATIAT